MRTFTIVTCVVLSVMFALAGLGSADETVRKSRYTKAFTLLVIAVLVGTLLPEGG